MSTLSLRLPDSLHQQVKSLAAKDGISINQFVASAIAEKMSALLTEDYLMQRATRGNPKSFLKAMTKVSRKKPDLHDRL